MNDTDARKTITVAKSPFSRCEELKREGESWSQFLHRVADALENDSKSGEHGLNDVLTEAHIDDIATATASRTVERLQAVMR